MKRNIFSKEEVLFFQKQIPFLEERLEIMNMAPENLVGREVISIRSGFGTIGGGQKMVIERIYYFGNNKVPNLALSAIPESDGYDPEHKSYVSVCSNRAYDFILWDRKKKYKF